MKTSSDLKNMVKERYDRIATQDLHVNASSCCGATTSSNKVYNIMMEDYTEIEGYAEVADLGLGCGLPTAFAKMKAGDTVIDLGSGAGNDCFVARHEVGVSGKVIGIDFTTSMLAQARLNAEKLGYNNVEFREGDIEQMPVNDKVADVIVSNCVLNLVPNKKQVFKEMKRVLKAGGHFSVSDIVLVGELPAALKEDAEMYAGCVAGAIQKQDYLNFIESAGFKNIQVQKEKPIQIPDDILTKYLNEDEIASFNTNGQGIYSITVYAEKAIEEGSIDKTTKPKISIKELNSSKNSCSPNSGCC